MKSQEYLEKLKELVIEHLMEIHQPDDKDDPEEVAIVSNWRTLKPSNLPVSFLMPGDGRSRLTPKKEVD